MTSASATAVPELTTRAGISGSYPGSWSEFIGNEKAKRMLQVACRSAQIRGEPLSHVLLASGTPGIGKTSLALLAAAEMGCELRLMSGRITTDQARIALATMSDGDLLLLDEIHTLVSGGKRHAEWLLHLLADGVLMGPMGAERQPRITVIGTTTDVGRLPETIVSRFPIRPTLQPYSLQEAVRIAITMAAREFSTDVPLPDLESMSRIAVAAGRNPRTIRAVLQALRDLELVTPGSVAHQDSYDLTEALEWLGLTEDGLTVTCLRYLEVLVHEFGGTAGERALVDRLQEPGGLAHTERLLIDHGLIRKTRRGRSATQAGIRRAHEAKEAA